MTADANGRPIQRHGCPPAANRDAVSRLKEEAKKKLRAPASADLVHPPSMLPHPSFPPLPRYGPPSALSYVQNLGVRISSFVLSVSFLGAVLVGAMVSSLPGAVQWLGAWLRLRDPHAGRPFYAEEKRRKKMRHAVERGWRRSEKRRMSLSRPAPSSEDTGTGSLSDKEDPAGAGVGDRTYTPTEGGRDALVSDVGYYARRVGLEVEPYAVQTEDGFVLELWHVYDPAEQAARPAAERAARGPSLIFDEADAATRQQQMAAMLAERAKKAMPPPKFPVLLIPGLLQSAGAYCVHDDDALAFYLCKAGYDVWLGNNRCGTRPRHVALQQHDPRMWAWTLRHMAVLDLPALTSRVLRETGFAKLGLVCHSQGTAASLVALARAQRPELGACLTVVCALAPAAYAGPLLGNTPWFRLVRALPPTVFRFVFGIHAFIPFMMAMHWLLPGRLYGWLGYRVFSFLFGWTDARWDRGLRDRLFQFAPVYVSAELMRWWLGADGFARHQCILETTGQAQETNWYDEQVPPLALWVAGRDDLVDGWPLLRRLLPAPAYAALLAGQGYRSVDSGPHQGSALEPHVRVVHAKMLPDYGHLDVIWAVDAVDQVFAEVRTVLWKTCPARESCRMPKGCEGVPAWQ